MRRIIYPATRAVEHATTLPGIRPIRLFPVLWPLWQVDTRAEIYDQQDFETIDHFVVRAIEEGGIRDRDELVTFLNVPTGVIDRCVAFLSLIGNLTITGRELQLTEVGRRSARDGIRYVPSTSRQTLLIDKQSGWPLPRVYYDANIPVLDTPEIEEGQLGDRSRFLSVFTTAWFRSEVLHWLEKHPDRVGYNLPGQLRNLRHEGVRDGFLPSYLIETEDHRILAYTNAAEDRDEFLEGLCAKTSVEHLIEAKDIGDPADIWRRWLAKSTAFGAGTLRKSRAGGWRVVLHADAFGDGSKLPLNRIGSYQFFDHHFIQVWCPDPATRHRALVHRALGIATLPETTTRQQLADRIRVLAASLETAEVSYDELRRHATGTDDDRLRRLAALDEGTS